MTPPSTAPRGARGLIRSGAALALAASLTACGTFSGDETGPDDAGGPDFAPKLKSAAGSDAELIELQLDNSAMPGADALSSIVNFPDQNLDLLSVYRANVRTLTTALTG